jgi:predicted O-methyltransferase YrrM
VTLGGLRKRARIAAACVAGGYADYQLARTAIVTHRALQRSFELMTLARHVRELRPRVVVEIGTHLGGTLFCWSKLAAADAVLVSVDLPAGPGTEAFDAFVSGSQKLICVRADSSAPETLAETQSHLDGRPIDFLFIDGDHRYDAVRTDYERYGSLVRRGGLIALHDIVSDRSRPASEVHRLWPEIARSARTESILDVDSQEGFGMGIGLVWV